MFNMLPVPQIVFSFEGLLKHYLELSLIIYHFIPYSLNVSKVKFILLLQKIFSVKLVSNLYDAIPQNQKIILVI